MAKYLHLTRMNRIAKAFENALPEIINEIRAFPQAARVAASEIVNVEYVIDLIELEILRSAEKEKQAGARPAVRSA